MKDEFDGIVDVEQSTTDVDQPVLTKRQIQGWLAYAAAAEPYSVVCISSLLPIVLEALASGYGRQTDNRDLPCDTDIANYKCVVKVGSLWLDTASFSLYCVSVSVFLQAIVFISMGALGDHGTRRKTFLLAFAFIGSIFTILFAAIRSASLFWLAGVFVIISNIAFGASYVLYYAFIPALARDHPDVVSSKRNVAMGIETWTDYQFVKDKVSNSLSSHSMAVGYGAGVALLIIAAGIAEAMDQTTYSLQLGIALTGLWWFLVSFFTLKFMPSQPGEPLHERVNLFLYSWIRVGKTLREAKSLKETFKYLIAWFILSDGSSTIISLAIFMGKKTFLLDNTHLMIGAILVPFAALIGTYMWLFIQRKLGLTTKQTLFSISVAFAVVPVYALIGFSGVFGLVYKAEIWPTMIYFGLMLGAFQSFSRVMYASLTPKGKESEFFSLYGITDKSSSWLGPLITGAIIENNDTRWGFIFPLCMMIIPLFLILWVNVEKGVKDAERFSEEHSDAKDGL
ncbi:Autophagy protein 22 [Entomortierella chlamydospora]|uniref:Autophagy-related protein n=1 Tax=Entomortierella chlamydospora TaxID=101097 RepID=A0A9P6MTI7_9FUNG|nr:Autophagy protein 22 [Entomortierella chlamydospora]KAG0013161.1 Autophagy protein 22 [Entomortierella chlamydospora]